jgi:hypothetical protein
MKTLLASSWLAAFAIAQDPAADVATALLRRDAAAAASAAASAATPALRARLQAALLPASERAAAMLAVARAFPADPEADRALVAGAAAVLAGCRREQAVPELDVWNAVTDDDDFDADGLAPVVLGLREVVAARRTAGGDAALLQDAEAMLSLACVSRFGLWPARVPVGSTWQRPAQLAEPLQLRLLPCGPGYLPWHELDSLGAPLWTATLPVAGPFELPQMPPGDWLLEVTSTKSPWRGVRRVLVSDLEAVALSQDGHLAIAAFDARGPTAARWELWRGGSASERGELGAAPASCGCAASRALRGSRMTAASASSPTNSCAGSCTAWSTVRSIAPARRCRVASCCVAAVGMVRAWPAYRRRPRQRTRRRN